MDIPAVSLVNTLTDHGPASKFDAGATLPETVPAAPDVLELHPLDLGRAIQIVLSEVRAMLGLPGSGEPGGALGGLSNPATAAQSVVLMVLQALPEPQTLKPEAWLAEATKILDLATAALDSGVAAVVAWREVPRPVADGAHALKEQVLTALTDEPPDARWLRPEWLGLAPRIESFWRRRRRVRHGLSDPDLRSWERGEDECPVGSAAPDPEMPQGGVRP